MKAAGAGALLLMLVGCTGASGDVENVNGGTTAASAAGARARASEAARPAREAARPARGTVLFAGTSLTAGLGLDPEDAYTSLVEARIDSAGLPYRVVNAGISGETSSGLLRRLDWLLEGEFNVIVVETGANDGLRGIPVSTVRANVDTILTRIRATHPAAEVVLVQMEAPPNLGAGYTRAFRALYGELARKHGATLMPFLLDGVAGVPALNQADGIHPNEAGSRLVAATVWRTLEPMLR